MKTMLAVFMIAILGSMIPSYAGVQYSLTECQQKAQAGDAEAQWQLACRYRDGQGVAKNMRKAVSFSRMAAEKGHKQACFYLSELYSKGTYVKKDLEQAITWREKAELIQEQDSGAKEKSAEASEQPEPKTPNTSLNSKTVSQEDIIEVALDYLYGRQLHEKNPKLGTSLLYGEAKDGNKSAQRVFVQMFAKGVLNFEDESIRFDLIETWIDAAAQEGLAAAFRLKGAIAYERARYAEAIQFWKTAWKKGDMVALRHLALIHDRFESADEEEAKRLAPYHSDKEAIFFYEKALEHFENEPFLMLRLAMLKFITKDEKNHDRKEAENLLRRCYEQKPNDTFIANMYGKVSYANACTDLKQCNEYYEKKYTQAERAGLYEQCESIRKQWKRSVEKIEIRINKAKRLIKDK